MNAFVGAPHCVAVYFIVADLAGLPVLLFHGASFAQRAEAVNTNKNGAFSGAVPLLA